MTDNLETLQNDLSFPQYYPPINGQKVVRDDTHTFMKKYGMFRRFMLDYIVDEFRVFTKKDKIDYDDWLKTPDDIIYQNSGYQDYEEDKIILNLNVPIGWNCLRRYSNKKIEWEERKLDIEVTSGDWAQAVYAMGKWYELNIHTYQGTTKKPRKGRTYYDCSLFPSGPRGVGDDCTGFCWACIQYYWDLMHEQDPENCNQETYDEIMELTWGPASAAWGHPDGSWPDKMAKYGFEVINYSLDSLQPFDMVMGSVDAGADHGHGEIYVGTIGGKRKAFAWGNIHDGQDGHQGMPCGFANFDYNLIYRMSGQEEKIEEFNNSGQLES